MEQKLLAIGTVVKTIGLQGKVKVQLASGINFRQLSGPWLPLFFKTGNVWKPLSIVNISQLSTEALEINFEEYPSATLASTIVGQELYAVKTDQAFQSLANWLNYQAIINQEPFAITEIWNNGYYPLIKIAHSNSDNKTKVTEIWVPMIAPYLIKIDDVNQQILLNLEGLV